MRRLPVISAAVAALALLTSGTACSWPSEDTTCGHYRQIAASAGPFPAPMPANAVPTPSLQPRPGKDDMSVTREVVLDAALRFRGGDLLGPLQWVHDPQDDELSRVEVAGDAVAVTRGLATGFHRASDGTLIRAYETDQTFTSTGGRLLVWDRAVNEIGGYDIASGQLQWCTEVSFPKPSESGALAALPELVTADGDQRRVLAFHASQTTVNIASIDVPSGEVMWQRRIPGRWSHIDAGSGNVVLSGQAKVRVHDWRTGEPRTEIGAPGQPLAGISSGHVVVADQAGGTLAAFDFTGKPVWTVDIKERTKHLRLTRAALLVQAQNYGGPIGVYRLSDGERVASLPRQVIGQIEHATSSPNTVYLPTLRGILAIDVRRAERRRLPLPTGGGGAFVAGDRLLLLHDPPSGSEVIMAFQLPG